MKVLREGKSWLLEHDCSGFGNGGKGCGALLGIGREDLYYFRGLPGDSWGSREAAVMFKCPCCGQVTDLGLNDWPRNVKTLKTWTKEWQDA
jgi:hypothetical protein